MNFADVITNGTHLSPAKSQTTRHSRLEEARNKGTRFAESSAVWSAGSTFQWRPNNTLPCVVYTLMNIQESFFTPRRLIHRYGSIVGQHFLKYTTVGAFESDERAMAFTEIKADRPNLTRKYSVHVGPWQIAVPRSRAVSTKSIPPSNPAVKFRIP